MTTSGSQDNDEICCPKFDPTPWDEQLVTRTDKQFIKKHVFTLFYIPINFGVVMKATDTLLKKAQATVQDGMWLADHTSMWNMDLYIAVDKIIPEATNVTLSGNFFSKVYEGDFKQVGNRLKEFATFMSNKQISLKKTYIRYTTCPKCAKKYGKNYVVLMGEIE